MSRQVQAGLNATILDALAVGTSIHIEAPSTPQDRGLYIVEAYSHSQRARAKRSIDNLGELADALAQVVDEVAPPKVVATDSCDDLV